MTAKIKAELFPEGYLKAKGLCKDTECPNCRKPLLPYNETNPELELIVAQNGITGIRCQCSRVFIYNPEAITLPEVFAEIQNFLNEGFTVSAKIYIPPTQRCMGYEGVRLVLEPVKEPQ